MFMKRFPRPHVTDMGQILVGLTILLACGLVSVMVFPSLDYKLGNTQPTLLSIVGPAASISLVTIGVLFWLAERKTSYTKRLLVFLSIFAALVVFVKFTLSPSILFVAERSFQFEGPLADMWSSPGMVLFAIVVGVFLMYMAVFSILRHGFSKKLGIDETKRKAPVPKTVQTRAARAVTLLAFVGLAVLSGGAVILVPLFILFTAFSSVDPIVQYLGFVFSGVAGVMMAAALASAAGFLAFVFDEAATIAITRRDIAVFVSVVWIALGLLVVYHVLWAVYLFVLVTFWPFKVTTVVPK